MNFNPKHDHFSPLIVEYLLEFKEYFKEELDKKIENIFKNNNIEDLFCYLVIDVIELVDIVKCDKEVLVKLLEILLRAIKKENYVKTSFLNLCCNVVRILVEKTSSQVEIKLLLLNLRQELVKVEFNSLNEVNYPVFIMYDFLDHLEEQFLRYPSMF